MNERTWIDTIPKPLTDMLWKRRSALEGWLDAAPPTTEEWKARIAALDAYTRAFRAVERERIAQAIETELNHAVAREAARIARNPGGAS